MKILHLTDIHGSLKHLDKIGKEKPFDLILLSGDNTHFGRFEETKTVIEALETLQPKIFAVSGNCDYPESIEFLREKGILIENEITLVNNIQIIGLGGSLPCPGSTPNEYSEDFYQYQLDTLIKNIDKQKPIILVSHQPPYKTKNDKILPGLHAGSKSIRKFIEKIQPVACLTGHIHEGKGIDFIGECPVINPGPFRNGHFALINIIGEHDPEISLF
ncbi:MAG: metallophosphoesterase [Bacteroidales bacterium]|nr:metallophosphoesterase [Bacteroidales bacterium]MBN2820725.1 metallophosphoesterase [Bacteroidales bacterium]